MCILALFILALLAPSLNIIETYWVSSHDLTWHYLIYLTRNVKCIETFDLLIRTMCFLVSLAPFLNIIETYWVFSHDRDIYLIQFTAESAPNLQTTSRKRPRFAGRSGYEMRESTIMKRRSGGDGIQTPRVRCTPTKRVPPWFGLFSLLFRAGWHRWTIDYYRKG